MFIIRNNLFGSKINHFIVIKSFLNLLYTYVVNLMSLIIFCITILWLLRKTVYTTDQNKITVYTSRSNNNNIFKANV